MFAKINEQINKTFYKFTIYYKRYLLSAIYHPDLIAVQILAIIFINVFFDTELIVVYETTVNLVINLQLVKHIKSHIQQVIVLITCQNIYQNLNEVSVLGYYMFQIILIVLILNLQYLVDQEVLRHQLFGDQNRRIRL